MEEMDKNKEENRERNKMKDMPVGKLMIQMGIPTVSYTHLEVYKRQA